MIEIVNFGYFLLTGLLKTRTKRIQLTQLMCCRRHLAVETCCNLLLLLLVHY